MYCQSYVQKLPNVAETRGGKPIGNISGGSLGSPSWTQFTYFDLIGPAYDSTSYTILYTHVAKGCGKGVRVAEAKLWLASCFAKLYRQIPNSNQRIGCSC
ncbi:unnamed protein product [Lasius platythorax]|uniref:Uncharacterized protein n=1 Tax=Lasius platythorax TaxID=488582 RepID=A0AAV2N7J6_9HYME